MVCVNKDITLRDHITRDQAWGAGGGGVHRHDNTITRIIRVWSGPIINL